MKAVLILLFLSLSGCAGAYIEKDRMFVMSLGKSYIKACRPDQEQVAVPVAIFNGKPEMARWARLTGDTIDGTLEAIPMVSNNTCVVVGNNTPPQGVWGKMFDFLASVAPFVAMAFGIPAL